MKVLKRSLDHALHPGVELAYDELITLLARISYSINQRPLGLANVSESSLQDDILAPLTPNMMLLGRSSNESPAFESSGDDRFSARLEYVSSVEATWWKRWSREVLPTLLPYRRWRRSQENLGVGDIVLMWFPGIKKGYYRLAKVVNVYPDEEGLVRTVRIVYRKTNSLEARDVCGSNNLVNEELQSKGSSCWCPQENVVQSQVIRRDKKMPKKTRMKRT